MIVTTFLLLSLSIILYSWWYLIKDFKRHKIPGPVPLPIIGNGHMFLGDSAAFLSTLSRLLNKYGDVTLIYVLSNRYVVLSHPQYVEGIISSSETIVKGRSYNFLHDWLGQGLLTSSGQRWRSHRKFLTPAFHYNILQTFLPVMLKNKNILIEKLQKLSDGTSIDLFPIIALAALEIITESIMGVTVNAQKNSQSKYVKAIEEVTEIVSKRMRNVLIAPNPLFKVSPHKIRQDKALEILHGQTSQVIEARREELKRIDITNITYDSDYGMKNKHAFLDLLLLAEVNGKKIDDSKIREEVDTFMFEGHDTTTSGLVFCLYCISRHAEVQEKLLREQKSIYNDDMIRDPTYKELQQMKYLELVIKESLRLYPPVPLIERIILNDIRISGLDLLKDSAVLINIYHMQRHPDIYENPLEFKPERFDTNLNNAFSWLAFSAGPRNCIGQKFAMMEMKVILSSIVKHFQIMPAGLEPVLTADLILRSKNGVYVKLKPRI